MAEELDQLVKLSKAQADPGSASGKDFKVAVPKAGEASGADQLVKLANYQESPRCAEDGHSGKGYGTPIVEGKRTTLVGKCFPASVNKGEASDMPGKAENVYSLDLKTGQLSPNVYKAKK